MNALRTFVLPAVLVLGLHAETFQLSSPDEKLAVALEVRPAGLTYRVTYGGKTVLLDSGLGLSLYSGAYQVAKQSTRSSDTQWSPLYGERKVVPDRYRELTLELKDKAAPFRPLHLVFRAYNEGVAFRYRILGQGRFLYAQEYSEFQFPKDTLAYEEHKTEGEYFKVPVTAIQPTCERPLTVEYGNGLFASIVEAAAFDYPRMQLSPVRGKPGTLFSDLDGPVEAAAPYSTPWRALIVGERPGDLLERNYLVANLNPPSALKDTSWIKPGKVIREVTLSTKGGKECVDFAVKRGLQYIEYDAGWYGYEYDDASDATRVSLDPRRVGNIPNHGGLDLQDVIAYGKERGIGVFLYVNRKAMERQLDQILPLFQKWGVKGIKFGFVSVGPQQWTTFLHEAIRKAAQHQLMIDIHDSYRPSGFTRTYPNLLTQEGVRGNEHMPTATHNATLPFTRFLAGPADYTICYYTDRIKTTRAHQMALPVIYYSPLQFMYWYDKPSAYNGEPEVEFFDKLPTVWDDTRVLDSRIGEYVTVARRSGREWFVGSITNETARELRIPLGFLEQGRKYTAHIYENGAGKNGVRMEKKTVDAAGLIRAALPASGGQAIRLAPE